MKPGHHSRFLLLSLSMLLSSTAAAQNVLIKNALVHSVTGAQAQANTDVLVRDGRIRAVGKALSADGDTPVYDAAGRPLTPGLFAGIAPIGLVEVSAEESSVDSHFNQDAGRTGQTGMRPEFNPTYAYNPHASAVAVNRIEGLTYTMLNAGVSEGGSIIAGHGAVISLDGRYDAVLAGSETLFVYLGGSAGGLAGHSRAGQYMLLEQAFREARSSSSALRSEARLLTASGREVLARFLDNGRVVVSVNRAADILQVLRLAEQHRFRPIIYGGAEAWMVAEQLAAANTPVILNPLNNLPANFDQLGARLDNATLLAAAGVPIVFSFNGDAHNTRKIRQAAGNAVAHGLPWPAALAAITATPARVFGLGEHFGTIEVGKQADLVLWDDDPLEVTSTAQAVWIQGRAVNMRSRQTLLRDRYLPQNPALPRQYIKP